LITSPVGMAGKITHILAEMKTLTPCQALTAAHLDNPRNAGTALINRSLVRYLVTKIESCGSTCHRFLWSAPRKVGIGCRNATFLSSCVTCNG
jgi:hypothetical protein